ncbi:phage tail tape measure protein [Rahnella aceris]|uniref:phage tail tape measure protein n=1 Tax=Rahnella sp. (strain Y9602) TaxID=2703885 RepID=UPI0020B8A986|nr:phage tail tape measure protein [Rahnella aceris]
MFDAMQEASARGINDDALAKVTDDALKFSVRYGESAVEFVKSSADINAAVAGLTNAELPRVTVVANTAAKALKSTAGEASEFMGQMFTQFSGYAAEVGKVQFAEELAGKMAYMKNQFGTDMATIKDLMEGARGVGSNYGVGMDEQLAVLGELQRSLGTEASGSYEGFLSGAAAGAQKLGLSFQDAQGKMLSMPAMLEKLQGKYGQSIEGNLKAQGELDAAFGDSAAVIKQLYGNVDLLKRNITELGSNDGMKRATEMAEKMTRPWDRLTAIWFAMRAAIGSTLLPVLYPLVNKIADGGEKLTRWMRLFPNIARVIGYATVALLSFAAVGAIANIVMGVHGFVMMGVTRLLAPMARLLGLNRVAMVASNAVTQLFSAGLRGLRVTLLAASMAARIGSASFLLMIAPVAAIALAIAAVVIAVIKFWQPIKAFVSGFISGFGQAAGALTPFSGLFSGIGQAISWVWDSVKTLVGWFGNLLTPIQMTQGQLTNVTSAGETFGRLVAAAINIILIPLELVFRAIGGMVDMFKIVRDGWIDVVKSFDINSPVESFEKIASVIGNVFGKLWDSLKASFTGTYNWIVEKLNNIPGVNIELKEVPVMVTPKGMPPANTMPNSVANASAAMPPGFNGVTNQISGAGNKNPVLQPPQPIGNDILTGGTVKGVERGGLKKEINTKTETTIDNSKKIGTVNIHPSKGLTPAELMEWQELN